LDTRPSQFTAGKRLLYDGMAVKPVREMLRDARGLGLFALLLACAEDDRAASPNATDAGGGREGDGDAAQQPLDAASDAGAASAGPFAVAALPFPIEPGEPIDAPDEQWTFVGFPNSRCANGTPTGIAINPVAGAVKGLLVFMQGGGACWDAQTCLVAHSSVHLDDTVGEAVILSEARALSGLFQHDNAGNPFSGYAYVYMPYCTGDLHAGTKSTPYDGPNGTETVHHHGGRNVAAYLARLIPSFPELERVVVTGISAGGFGATFNWWRYQAAFPRARVDVLDDAGLIVDAPDDRWSTMVEAWAMVLPPGCTECRRRMSAFLPFYGEHLVAPRRYALTGFLGDAVIASYFGLTSDQVGVQLLALRAGAAANHKTFFLSGTQHSVIGEGALMTASDGASFLPWLLELAGDGPAWDHAGP
jgi:hypothetical protein